MGFNRIYTKKRGEAPDLGDPLVIKTDATMEAIVRSLPFSGPAPSPDRPTDSLFLRSQCDSIHKNIRHKFKYAIVRPFRPPLPVVARAVSHPRRALVQIWGKSSKFAPQPQKVGMTHRCAQDDGALPPSLSVPPGALCS